MERCQELESLTRQLYVAVARGDISFFERHLSRGGCCIVIGTAPEEWWENYEDAVRSIRAQMAGATGAIEIDAGDVRAYRQGNVGWIADRPTLKLGNSAAECRHTSVFLRVDGDWQIVQHHFSIGVSNEVAFGPDASKLGGIGS